MSKENNSQNDLVRNIAIAIAVQETHDSKIDDPLAKGLIHAADSGTLSEVVKLLENSANPNVSFSWGTALTKAICSERDALLKTECLLAAKADPELLDMSGLTPLMIAAANEKLDIIRLLVRNGANINSQAHPMQWTALMNASCLGADSAVSELLSLNADLSLKSEHGLTAIDIAKSNGKHSVLKLFLKELERLKSKL